MRSRLAVTGALMALTVAVFLLAGWPDPAGGVALLSGHDVSGTGRAALVRLLCWLAVGGLVVVAGVVAAAHAGASRRRRTLALVAVSVTLLVAGIAHHQSGYGVCCSDATTIERVQGLVR